jgi:hypothetical protein
MSRIDNRKIPRISYKGHRVDALAPNAEEGRGRLRKVAGSRLQALYPQISEWGNLTQ